MISKSKIKLIHSLEHKKYRAKENLFIAEGDKLAREALNSDFKVRVLICTEDFYSKQDAQTIEADEIILASHDEIRKCSLLKNPQQAIALCEIPLRCFDSGLIRDNLTIALDGIQDPGNMGTIVRMADWFGVKTIFASENTADLFNPKVVQASMGAVFRVSVFYTSLPELVQKANTETTATFGTFLSGENIYSAHLPESAMVVMGNEGQGISPEVERLIAHRIFIPPFGSEKGGVSESLNVSTATAIICSEFRRNTLRSYSK